MGAGVPCTDNTCPSRHDQRHAQRRRGRLETVLTVMQHLIIVPGPLRQLGALGPDAYQAALDEPERFPVIVPASAIPWSRASVDS